jgi:hypothetical protein
MLWLFLRWRAQQAAPYGRKAKRAQDSKNFSFSLASNPREIPRSARDDGAPVLFPQDETDAPARSRGLRGLRRGTIIRALKNGTAG